MDNDTRSETIPKFTPPLSARDLNHFRHLLYVAIAVPALFLAGVFFLDQSSYYWLVAKPVGGLVIALSLFVLARAFLHLWRSLPSRSTRGSQ